jgi:hypothetical protein
MDLIDNSTFSRSIDDTEECNELRRERRRLISIDEYTLREAQDQIASCEACTPDQVEILFDEVLDWLTGSDPQSTDYVLNVPARCPRCQSAVRTGRWKSFIGPDGKRNVGIVPGTLVTVTGK